MRTLGKHGLSFDLCMRPTELKDGIKLAERCADTRFIVDHCGNADPKAFSAKLAGDEKPWHTADGWRRDIEGLAKRPNVICKISGIVARAPKGWRAVVGIVLDGTFHCSREFARRRIASGGGGAIVNIGASYAWTGGPGFAHSAAAKAGVKNLTETLAVEWAPYGIRVNLLVPGLMPHADETAEIRGVPERGQEEDTRSPAGRVGQPRELGWAATYLASDYASYVTGATLTVDGTNWQRRAMLQPPFTPIRDQLGRR